jgi:hypothetical protein
LRRDQPRGQSRDAARCAVLSTFALIGCAAAQGALRALLAFIWVLLLIAALALEWNARRRMRAEQAPQDAGRSSRHRRPGAGGRAASRTQARRALTRDVDEEARS